MLVAVRCYDLFRHRPTPSRTPPRSGVAQHAINDKAA
jgi:hypothetical protein